ncbi:DegT/DnrJ/EryC1/StrS family aminotransferase [Rhodomicrobium lacus]|uniref:DegT/DnrJ/EryC1/StrS family aminotransferase n=1 Tax=Rhodomicrobium lacus TaxID=2498452 RepID=UPI0026E35965|nr:DegT/DnrJ/EryC1/StrS aminotransferase family protein [Rhodomicrobium lacus]WKW51473.1 DegT/DnrJ/EryC1/StrS aminotransferase family protein [Rhodomicrobium lacus]
MSQIKPFFLDLDDSEIGGIQAEMGNILRSGQLILSKHTEAFEAEFASYVGTRHAVTYNTATSALEVLCVLKGARGKRVAVPSNTNFASVEVIVRAGGQPVFMDMTPEFYAPNLDLLKYTVEKHGVSGVMWVHIGGIITPDFAEIAAYCRSRNLFLIEDCAHAHGSFLGGKSAGSFGDGGAFSFFPTKVMTTMEGGMIVTDSKEDADLARSFRNQGKRHAAYGGLHYDHGNSWRISEIAAYMGLVQLAKLDRMVKTRTDAARIVSNRLRQIGVDFCETSHMDQASTYKLIVRLPDGVSADAVKKKLAERGVICGGGVYEVPCHLQPVFADIPCDRADLKATEIWCPRQICPPITSGTTPADADRIATAMVEALG